MLSRRLITIFCLTLTISFSAKNDPAHALPFGRIAQEIMSLYAHNPSKNTQTRNKPPKQPEVGLPSGTLSRAIIQKGRDSICESETPRSEIKLSSEGKCRLEDSTVPKQDSN